jgi:hypothetical protein
MAFSWMLNREAGCLQYYVRDSCQQFKVVHSRLSGIMHCKLCYDISFAMTGTERTACMMGILQSDMQERGAVDTTGEAQESMHLTGRARRTRYSPFVDATNSSMIDGHACQPWRQRTAHRRTLKADTHAVRLVVAEVRLNELREVTDHRPQIFRDGLDRALLLHECDKIADDRVSWNEEHGPESGGDLRGLINSKIWDNRESVHFSVNIPRRSARWG